MANMASVAYAIEGPQKDLEVKSLRNLKLGMVF